MKNSKLLTLSFALVLVSEAKAVGFECVTPYATGRMCSKIDRNAESTKYMTIVEDKDDYVTDFTISSIASEGMKYLPIKVHLTFPNIEDYVAYFCDIVEVSKANFESLIKIHSIHLQGNKLETVGSDTFVGLLNLKFIGLGRNKIKFLSGQLLKDLPNLSWIDLQANSCIDDEFIGRDLIAKLPAIIDENCGHRNQTSTKKLFDLSCGVVLKEEGFITSAVGGVVSDEGKWPFLVALFTTPSYSNSTQFFCGASLITTKHILTAAHCIHPKNDEAKLQPQDIVACVGAYDLKDSRSRNVAKRMISEIVIHKDWKYRDVKYDADLAILFLSHSVEFSEYVQPVCLTADNSIQNEVKGAVTGWGKSESSQPHETIPREVHLNSVSAEVCFEKDYKLGQIFSRRMFCAGGEGSGPCSGDSGGGFFVKFRGVWTLKGIVSVSPFKSTGECDVNRFALYTKVSDYADWIRTTINDDFPAPVDITVFRNF